MVTDSKPPKHLTAASRRFWEWVTGTYSLDPDGLKILLACCEALDTAELARQALVHDGMFYLDRHGVRRCHPAVKVIRESRQLFLRSLSSLGLEHAVNPNELIAHTRGEYYGA